MALNDSLADTNGRFWVAWEPGCANGTWMELSYNVAVPFIWMTVPGFLLVIGLTGNGLTIAVLLRSYKAASSTVQYLMALAVSDSVFLVCTPLTSWLTLMIALNVKTLPLTCKLITFLSYLTYYASNWLLVAVTAERTIGVVMPHSVKSKCTRKTSFLVICGIIGTLVLINSHILIGFNVFVNKYNETECLADIGDYTTFWIKYWPWISLFLAFVLPFPFLAVGNGIIVVQLCQTIKRRKALRMPHQMEKSQNKAMRSITVTLVLLSIVFVITNIPHSFFLLYNVRLREKANILPCDQWSLHNRNNDLYMNVKTAVDMALYLNPTFNFIMYVASGKSFRKELLYILTCRQHESESTELMQTTTTTLSVNTQRKSVK